MNTTTTTRIRRLAIAATATMAAMAGGAAPSEAAPISSLRGDCERAGGTFAGDGSIRPTCHDARLRSPFTSRAADDCTSIHGEFTFELHDDGRRVTWRCDISAL